MFGAFLRQLKKATKPRGSKTELAKFLGVPLQRVYDWLSGSHIPGAEVTLRMQKWVQQAEKNQEKALNGDRSTIKGKTRKR